VTVGAVTFAVKGMADPLFIWLFDKVTEKSFYILVRFSINLPLNKLKT
jgi:hypothetical protein